MREHRPLGDSAKTVLITCGVLFLVGVAAAIALFIVCVTSLNFH